MKLLRRVATFFEKTKKTKNKKIVRKWESKTKGALFLPLVLHEQTRR